MPYTLGELACIFSISICAVHARATLFKKPNFALLDYNEQSENKEQGKVIYGVLKNKKERLYGVLRQNHGIWWQLKGYLSYRQRHCCERVGVAVEHRM